MGSEGGKGKEREGEGRGGKKEYQVKRGEGSDGEGVSRGGREGRIITWNKDNIRGNKGKEIKKKRGRKKE